MPISLPEAARLVLTGLLCTASAAAQTIDLADLAPLRPHTTIPLLPEWAPLAIGAVVLVVVAVFFNLFRQRAKGPTAEKKINPLNAALDALNALEARADSLDPRAYSSEVSDILRGYIERAADLPAQEQTTEEFLQAIQNHPVFDPPTRESLAEFLALCDLAKFAQQSFESEEKRRLHTQAREMIETLYRAISKHRQHTQSSHGTPRAVQEAAPTA